MVANMFLIQSLELMSRISQILGEDTDKVFFEVEAQAARCDFHNEYVTPSGRIVSDTQAAYAIAICLNILEPVQRIRAGERLVELVRKNNFKIATGFAGTPFLCEALASTGHIQVAYTLLLERGCPSWLYPVTMGATTVWERWDSMLPNGDINPGEMTSFNHYAFGAIAKFLHEHIAGLRRLEPGWTKCRIAPDIGANFTEASASHVTSHGTVSCSWKTVATDGEEDMFHMHVLVPYGTLAEVIIPNETSTEVKTVGHGEWSFQSTFRRDKDWPVQPLKPKS
jgi:alpha-L-rhamnosidase